MLKGLKRKIKAHGGKVVGSLLFEVGTSMVVLTDLKERERVEKVFLRQKVEKSDLVSFCCFCEMVREREAEPRRRLGWRRGAGEGRFPAV